MSLHNSKAEALQAAANVGEGVTVSEYRRPQKEAYQMMDPMFAYFIAPLDPTNAKWIASAQAKAPRLGFEGHFEEASLVPGFEKELHRSIGNYAAGLATHVASRKMQREFAFGYNDISPNKQSLKKELKRRFEIFQQPHSSFANATSRLATFWYLAYKPLSAVSNVTQQLITTLPEMTMHWGVEAPVYWALSHAKALELGVNREGFKNKNPQLYAALERAKQRGDVEAQAFGELLEMKSGIS